MGGLVLGIDVSTTATKAVLIDGTGAVRGIGVAEYGFDVPRPLWSEQDPGLWWDGAIAAIRSVPCAGVPAWSAGKTVLSASSAIRRPAPECRRT